MTGFVTPLEFCCGSYYGYNIIHCMQKAIMNGTVYGGDQCKNPSQHVNWKQELIVQMILELSYLKPN